MTPFIQAFYLIGAVMSLWLIVGAVHSLRSPLNGRSGAAVCWPASLALAALSHIALAAVPVGPAWLLTAGNGLAMFALSLAACLFRSWNRPLTRTWWSVLGFLWLGVLVLFEWFRLNDQFQARVLLLTVFYGGLMLFILKELSVAHARERSIHLAAMIALCVAALVLLVARVVAAQPIGVPNATVYDEPPLSTMLRFGATTVHLLVYVSIHNLYLETLLSSVREQAQSLNHSLELLQTTADSMAQALIVAGPEGDTKFQNVQAERMFLAASWVSAPPAVGRTVTTAIVERVLRSDQPEGGRNPDDVRMTPDGRYVKVSRRATAGGDTVMTFTDVTEIQALNRQLRDAIAQLDRTRRQEVQEARHHMVEVLSRLARFKDGDSGHHIERVQQYVRVLARSAARLGRHGGELGEERIELMVQAAAMHDLGKIAIPDQVLRKPKSEWTAAERELMRTHARIGESTLLIAAMDNESDRSLLAVASRIAGAHHERWDGRGYPRGLQGDEIPLEARITALADTYDALTSDRHRPQPLSHDAACAELLRLKGTKLDPLLVDAFFRENERFRLVAVHYAGSFANPPPRDAWRDTEPMPVS